MRGCVAEEGQCVLTPGGSLTSFDGASGKYLCDGVYDLALVCDERSPFWFRVSVSIKEDSDGGLEVGRIVYVFFPEASITVKRHKITWVRGRTKLLGAMYVMKVLKRAIKLILLRHFRYSTIKSLQFLIFLYEPETKKAG